MNKQRPLCAAQGALLLSAVTFAVLQRPRSHRLAEHAAEMGGGGKAGYVELITRPVKRTDFAMAYMVIAATNDRKLNDEIHRICRQEGVYVNVASDREQCDFYFPGIYMEEGLVVGITASGLDHKKARRIREEIQNALERVAQENDNEEENDD